MHAHLLTVVQAEKIWQVLHEECGVRSDDLWQCFVFCHTRDRGCDGFRFQGSLGFGGKFRNRSDSWGVDCYPGDETPERLEMINRANSRLQELYAQEDKMSRDKSEPLPPQSAKPDWRIGKTVKPKYRDDPLRGQRGVVISIKPPVIVEDVAHCGFSDRLVIKLESGEKITRDADEWISA